MLHPHDDYLQLADWRRRVAELYAEVRRLSATDPTAAHRYWRETRERLYREHAQSPLPLERRAQFQARHFAYDPALRFVVPALPPDGQSGKNSEQAHAAEDAGETAGERAPHDETTATIPTSGGSAASFLRLGRVEIPFPAGTRQLSLFWLPDYAGGLFLSFRDATNGVETYGGGRYLLDAAKSADLGGEPIAGTLVLDFNFAYQPSCAFDPRWVCPLVPPENRLDLSVRAGERLQ
jgi:uncharacterized protein (DUF1684 family)